VSAIAVVEPVSPPVHDFVDFVLIALDRQAAYSHPRRAGQPSHPRQGDHYRRRHSC
jgi:hypothetical protein